MLLPYLTKKDFKTIIRAKNAIENEERDGDIIFIHNNIINQKGRLYSIHLCRPYRYEKIGVLYYKYYDGVIKVTIHREFRGYNMRKLKAFDTFEDFINFYKHNNSKIHKRSKVKNERM